MSTFSGRICDQCGKEERNGYATWIRIDPKVYAPELAGYSTLTTFTTAPTRTTDLCSWDCLRNYAAARAAKEVERAQALPPLSPVT